MKIDSNTQTSNCNIGHSEKKGSILAVLVVYQKKIEATGSWAELSNLLNKRSDDLFFLKHILIYDNTKEPHAASVPSAQITYQHDPSNGGTAAAYTTAAKLASSLDIEWLLLLDQDTIIPTNFLKSASLKLKETHCLDAAALVPYVRHCDSIISPAKITKFGSINPLKRQEKTNSAETLTAISSGTLIRSNVLLRMLPFPNELWLDYVDHWIFLQMKRGSHTVVVFDADIEHDLSIKAPSELSLFRLESILSSEALFTKSLGRLARISFPFRLGKRFLLYSFKNPRLAVALLHWAISKNKGPQ